MNQMESLTKFKDTILGIAGIAVVAVTKIKETAVSFVSKIFYLQTQKEVVRWGP